MKWIGKELVAYISVRMYSNYIHSYHGKYCSNGYLVSSAVEGLGVVLATIFVYPNIIL